MARVTVTLGRYTNDFMTSFYARSPSQFMIEYGWGGRDIELATWEPFDCAYGPSLWGPDRSWLSPEKRMEARELRLEAAAEGCRELVQVMPGNSWCCAASALDGTAPSVATRLKFARRRVSVSTLAPSQPYGRPTDGTCVIRGMSNYGMATLG